MHLHTFLLSLLACVALLPLFPASAHASTTPTEGKALAAAENDHTAYTLPPDKLAKADALDPQAIGQGGVSTAGREFVHSA